MNRTILFALLLAGPVAHAAAPDPHVAEDGSPDSHWRLRLDTSATWGIGGQMFLGADLHPTVGRPIWKTASATGTLDLGLDLNYGNEATFLAPWIDRTTTSGAGHRVQVLGTLGGTFHLGPTRRFGLGLHGVAGLNEWISAYTVDYADEDFSGGTVVSEASFVAGGRLTMAYRVHRNVGVNIVAQALLPTRSTYAIGFGHVGAGLSFYVH